MPHFAARLSLLPDCAGPGLLFPRQKVGNDGGVQPACGPTQVLPEKLSGVVGPRHSVWGCSLWGWRWHLLHLLFCFSMAIACLWGVARRPRGSLLAHGAPWGDGWPETTITPSLVSQHSCMWPHLQKKIACLCSRMLPSLSPLQMARAKPTTALRPPPASKSSLPTGENPERIFLEIILPRPGCRHGVWYENQLGRTAHQRKKEKENHTGCQTPSLGRAAPQHFFCLCRAWTSPAQLRRQFCLCFPSSPYADQSFLLVSLRPS